MKKILSFLVGFLIFPAIGVTAALFITLFSKYFAVGISLILICGCCYFGWMHMKEPILFRNYFK